VRTPKTVSTQCQKGSAVERLRERFLASAPNPSADVGLARSLRPRFGIWLTGVDYSNAAPESLSDFDDVDPAALERNRTRALRRRDSASASPDGGACCFSGLDLEITLLVKALARTRGYDAFCAKGRPLGLDGPRLRMGVMLSTL